MIGPDRLTHVVAVHRRQQDVEHDQIELIGTNPFETNGAVMLDLDIETVRRQASLYARRHTHLVFDHEDPHT